MNLPSDADGLHTVEQHDYAAAAGGTIMSTFVVPAGDVAPFEYRSLTRDDPADTAAFADPRSIMEPNGIPNRRPVGASTRGNDCGEGFAGRDRAGQEAALRSAVEAALQEGRKAGEQEGRRVERAEMEAEIQEAVARERGRLVDAVSQFKNVRERYFTDVEQEVVKLSLAIASRVLHREAQIDPLLLAGVVRVALEKMADRSGVVLRVAGADVAAWEQVFHATEDCERPRVADDPELERGECVLETKMGTVQLGVQVQLEEIEKGFFDLLNHRPVE